MTKLHETSTSSVNSPLIGLDRTGLAERFAPFSPPAYRVEQVYKWLYARGVRDPMEFSDTPKEFRQAIADQSTHSHVRIVHRTTSKVSKVVKYLFELHDGLRVEGVWIPEKDRAALCVSSQVGCALGCQFCATGTMGFIRNLSSGEILDQLLTVRFVEKKLVTHIVFMGMGEPLHNYDEVSRVVRIMNDPAGCAIAKRHITVSTAGWVPGIQRMIEDRLPCRLAISMGTPDEARRRDLMPVTRKYSLEALFAAAKHWALARDDRVTIEYTLLDGVNDSIDDIKRLSKLLTGIPAKINILTYNPGPDAPYQRPSSDRVEWFTNEMERRFNGSVTRRLSRGDEIGAACGQLVILSNRNRDAISEPVVEIVSD